MRTTSRFGLVCGAALAGLLLAGIAFAQGDALTALWQRGDFDAAREMIAQLRGGPQQNAAVLASAARAAEEIGDYADAAQLYGDYAQSIGEGRSTAYREARRRQWICLNQSGGASWVPAAQAEVRQRLAAATAGPPRLMALELEALLDEALKGKLAPGAELRTKHPDSDVVLRAERLALNEVANQREDAKRIAAARQLIADYPGCYWNHMAYRLWLFSCERQGDTSGLKAAASAYLAAFPDNALAQGAVSRYYLELDIEAEPGYSAARRSVELYAAQLGIRSDSDLASLNATTRALLGERRAEWQLPNKRELFVEYLGSRFNLARYELSRGQRKACLAQLEPLLILRPFSPEEEPSLSAFYFVAGQAKESLGDWPLAYRYYIGALVEPDPQGRYGLQAEPALKRVGQYLSDKERLTENARFAPAKAIALPSFSDITTPAGLTDAGALRAAWFDVDNDLDPDLLLDGSRLFINDGRRGFVDATRDWGLGLGGSSRTRFSGGLGEESNKSKVTGATAADIDNDGDLDLYTFGSGPGADVLWRNEGQRFVDITPVSGAPSDEDPTEAACWLDFDRDGWVDLAVAGQGRKASDATQGERVDAPQRLFRNTGRGAFSEVSPGASGLLRPGGVQAACSSLSALDANDDGLPDLFAAGRFGAENALWLADTEGRFSEAARGAGVSGLAAPLLLASDGPSPVIFARSVCGDSWGSAWGDLNNDGTLDLLTPKRNLGGSSNNGLPSQLFLLGQPGSPARERYSQLGFKNDVNCSNALLADLNNDGNLDVYLSSSGEGRRSALYLNSGDGSFSDVTYLASARVYNAYGSAAADIDSDGDLDLLVCSPRGVRLLRNDSRPLGWLSVICRGSGAAGPAGGEGGSNAAAIGARITVTCGPVSCVREVQSSTGLGCGNSLEQHFGLGAFGGLVGVSVRFPSGKVLTKSLAVSPGLRIIVDEEAGISTAPATAAAPAGGAKSAGQPAPKPTQDDQATRPERPEPPTRPSGPSRGGR